MGTNNRSLSEIALRLNDSVPTMTTTSIEVGLSRLGVLTVGLGSCGSLIGLRAISPLRLITWTQLLNP